MSCVFSIKYYLKNIFINYDLYMRNGVWNIFKCISDRDCCVFLCIFLYIYSIWMKLIWYIDGRGGVFRVVYINVLV